jgi:hypothetical protein
MGDTLRAFLSGSGGLSNQYIWLYTFNGDTVQLNHKMKESGQWSIMLSDGCTKKPIVKTFIVYVDTTQLKVGTIADMMLLVMVSVMTTIRMTSHFRSTT